MKSNIPKDAVLLIPEPEHENESARYGIAPGYYNSKQLLELLDQHQHNADAIHFFADMLETGNPRNDGFAQLLRANHADPTAIARIVQASLLSPPSTK